jgi:hypothetical protein
MVFSSTQSKKTNCSVSVEFDAPTQTSLLAQIP